MGAAENKAVIEHMYDELSQGNGQAFLDAMADDVKFTIIGTTKLSGTVVGKQALVERVVQPLAARLDGAATLTPERFIAEGDFVVMQAHGASTTKNGGTYNNTYCHVYRVVSGKVQEMTEYLDTELLTEALRD